MSNTSPLLAGPPSDGCFTGFKHTGTPVGRTETIAGMPTYITEPKGTNTSAGTKRVIMFLADVWGPMHTNNQLLQDTFAESGFIVLGPDYFLGDPVYIHTEETFDRPAWFAKSRAQAAELFPKWVQAVRQIYGEDAHYCAVGYCFGAPYALELATTDNVAASAFAHPALLTEDHFTKLTKPLFLSCAETDHTFPLPARRRAEDLLVAAGAQYHIQVFAGVAHGFTARGDPAVENIRWAKEESARGIANWFTRFCNLKLAPKL
ncbi:Alpha/Beta hydrolase protein [Infundibulicybe gibba]|nr:Alpha/Beta hydrolase protein [Infundibulicybe gibba]